MPCSAKAIEVARHTMMLTELYYYYANHQAAKAATPSSFNASPTGIKVACTAALISTFNIGHDHKTAHNRVPSLDRPSTNGLAGKPQEKRDGPRRQTQSRP
jgi:hypothetical protein